jgi:hypothetical protein
MLYHDHVRHTVLVVQPRDSNVSVRDKEEMSNDQQSDGEKCDVTVSSSHEGPCPRFATVNVNENQSQILHTIPLKGHLIKFDNVAR